MSKYILKATGEAVEPEVWRWVARYTDNTQLHQFDDSDYSFHQFKEIDQAKLNMFEMTDGNRSFFLKFDQDMKLVHFYRRYTFNALQPEEQKLTVYVFGYDRKKESVRNMIMPDGNLITTDDIESVKVS